MELSFKNTYSLKEFILANQQHFEERLLNEAINVKDKIEEIRAIGNINLLKNANKIVLFVIEERKEELIAFAKAEGIVWAKYQLTLAFKLEWIQALRRTLWNFLYHYDKLRGDTLNLEAFYEKEKNYNEYIDQFFSNFFINYSKYKDELLEDHRKLVENLSVPIIPINKEICVLPLIGTINSQRSMTIQEKVLFEIKEKHIQTLIIDLSGIAHIDEEITNDFLKIIEGASMMGCRTILTGLRPEIVRGVVLAGINFNNLADFKGTLQQALNEVLFKK